MAAQGIAVTVLSVIIVILGVAMLVSTIARGGGPLSTGVVFGVLFALGGALRLYLLRRTRP